jgi:hypothetical protein
MAWTDKAAKSRQSDSLPALTGGEAEDAGGDVVFLAGRGQAMAVNELQGRTAGSTTCMAVSMYVSVCPGGTWTPIAVTCGFVRPDRVTNE